MEVSAAPAEVYDEDQQSICAFDIDERTKRRTLAVKTYASRASRPRTGAFCRNPVVPT